MAQTMGTDHLMMGILAKRTVKDKQSKRIKQLSAAGLFGIKEKRESRRTYKKHRRKHYYRFLITFLTTLYKPPNKHSKN